MTDKDKKLAEKILEDTFISSGSFLDVDYIDLYVDAMQAYHEAKMKEVTDEDIHDVSNSAEYTRGYRDGWRDCCKDVKEFG